MIPSCIVSERQRILRFMAGFERILSACLMLTCACANESALQQMQPPAQPASVLATSGTNSPIPLSSEMSFPTPGLRPLVMPVTNQPAAKEALPPAATTNQGPQIPAANDLFAPAQTDATLLSGLNTRLELARQLRRKRQFTEASPIFVELLAEGTTDSIRQAALLELAMLAQDENDPARAQQTYAQFLNRWSNDPRAPEILLHQGQLFRQMGVNNLALAKFYGVMTAALALKNDQLEYYQRLVLQAQTEIAETHYQMGRFDDAAEYLSRLLNQGNPGLNRPLTQFRLVRSLSAIKRYDETANQAQDYLSRYTDSPEHPEVRFYLAQALKQLGRAHDSLQQVLLLLQEQKIRTQNQPAVWAYWQQRTGNEIANQLYREGDYTKALDIYVNLAQLDPSAAWRVPVSYQIGMTYERLQQPTLAVQTYSNILSAEFELGTNTTPGLKAVFSMSRWRIDVLQWQVKAESINRSLAVQRDKMTRAANSGPSDIRLP